MKKPQNIDEQEQWGYFSIDTMEFFVNTPPETIPPLVTISDYSGTDDILLIQDKVLYNGVVYSVTSIGEYAFSGSELSSVTIPDGIVTIESGAFEAIGLTAIYIGNTVTTIEHGAFYENQLTDITIPNSAVTIGESAFEENQLTNITIPNSVVTIESNAFASNELTSVTIGKHVTVIGDRAFEDNDITTIFCLGTNPPDIATAIDYDPFRRHQDVVRDEIDVVVPNGTTTAYLEAGWTGFKSITERN